MKNHAGDVRAFTHLNRSWYAEAHRKINESNGIIDVVDFGLYPADSGTIGEMTMCWYSLGANYPNTPRLEVFCDAWSVLSTFADVIAAMGKLDSQDITPEQFCDLLRSLGFADHTRETR